MIKINELKKYFEDVKLLLKNNSITLQDIDAWDDDELKAFNIAREYALRSSELELSHIFNLLDDDTRENNKDNEEFDFEIEIEDRCASWQLFIEEMNNITGFCWGTGFRKLAREIYRIELKYDEDIAFSDYFFEKPYIKRLQDEA